MYLFKVVLRVIFSILNNFTKPYLNYILVKWSFIGIGSHKTKSFLKIFIVNESALLLQEAK